MGSQRETEERSRRRNVHERLNFFDSLNNGLEGLVEKHFALKHPRLAFHLTLYDCSADPLANKVGDLWFASKTKSCQSTSQSWTIRPRLPCKEERNPPLRVLWCYVLSAPAWPLIPVHRESEDIFFYCLARSLALNAACHTGSSCWWKHMPNLCLNVYNFLLPFCLQLVSSPYLTPGISKTALGCALCVLGWQIDDSWFAPTGDAGRDKQRDKGVNFMRGEADRDGQGHNSLVLWERRQQTLQQ